MGQARTDPAGAVLRDGRVLVAGGYYASGKAPGRTLSQGWQPTSASRGATAGLAPTIELAVSRSGVLADVAPELPVAPVFATAELYNPATNTWSATGSMAVPRWGARQSPSPMAGFLSSASGMAGSLLLRHQHRRAGVHRGRDLRPEDRSLPSRRHPADADDQQRPGRARRRRRPPDRRSYGLAPDVSPSGRRSASTRGP